MMNRIAIAAVVAALMIPTAARAESAAPADRDGIAAEVNVLWPFIGISELKLVIPVVHDPQWRGSLIVGTYLDYAQFVRSGRAFIIAALPGYRQFVFHGLHVELAASIGVRHETMHPPDGATLDDFYIRAWPGIGYEYDITPRFFANARARVGVLVYRQSHQDEEKKLAPAGDLNLGVRF